MPDVTAYVSLDALVAASDAVIFDFDGILVDSEPLHYEAYRRVFARHGHRLDEAEFYDRWTRQGLGPQGEIARYRLNVDAQDVVAEKQAAFSARCRDGEVPLIPETTALVAALARRGTPLAVASGSLAVDIVAILAGSPLEAAFPIILGRCSQLASKPAPDIYLEAAQRLCVAPEACLAVEDSQRGVDAARAAGMRVVAVWNRTTAPTAPERAHLVLDGFAPLRLDDAAPADGA